MLKVWVRRCNPLGMSQEILLLTFDQHACIFCTNVGLSLLLLFHHIGYEYGQYYIISCLDVERYRRSTRIVSNLYASWNNFSNIILPQFPLSLRIDCWN